MFRITLNDSSFFDTACSPMEAMMSRRHTVKNETAKIASGSKLLSGSAACAMQAVRATVPTTNKQENKFN